MVRKGHAGNNRFAKLRAKCFMRLHHFLLNLVLADKFLQVKPQILTTIRDTTEILKIE